MLLQSIVRADLLIYATVVDRRNARQLARIARWVSRSGDGHCYALLGGLVAWLEPLTGWRFLCAGLLAFSVELPLYLLLKNSFKRHRPHMLRADLPAFITPSDRFSLPSGHTAAAFVMATLTSYFYPQWSALGFTWATAIGMSRVLLRVHFPTDILCGMALGVSSALMVIYALP